MTDFKTRIEKHKRGERGIKLYAYSGYLNNVASILTSTGTQRPHPPKHGSAVMIELHFRPSLNDYAVKVVNSIR